MSALATHVGKVGQSFALVYHASHLSYAAGQTVTADDALRAAIVECGADVAWASATLPQAPVLAFDPGAEAMNVDAMCPGAIYAADRFDKDAVRAAFDDGRVCNITLASKRDGQAQRVHGYTLAG